MKNTMNVCRIAILVVAYIAYSDAQITCLVTNVCGGFSAGGILVCTTLCSTISYSESGVCDASLWESTSTYSCNCAGTRTVNPITIATLNTYVNMLIPPACLAGCVTCGKIFDKFDYVQDQLQCVCK